MYYLNLYMPLFLVDDIYQRVIFPRIFVAGPLVLVTLALRFPGTAWLVGLVAMFGSEELYACIWYVSIDLSIYLSTDRSIYLSILSIYLFYLSIHLSIHPSIHPIYICVCMLIYANINHCVHTFVHCIHVFFLFFYIFSDRMTFRRFRKHGHHTAESSQHRNKETHLQLAEFLLFGFHVSGL